MPKEDLIIFSLNMVFEAGCCLFRHSWGFKMFLCIPSLLSVSFNSEGWTDQLLFLSRLIWELFSFKKSSQNYKVGLRAPPLWFHCMLCFHSLLNCVNVYMPQWLTRCCLFMSIPLSTWYRTAEKMFNEPPS